MNDNLLMFEVLLLVKAKAPEDAAETIEDVLEYRNNRIEMIIVYESQAKSF